MHILKFMAAIAVFTLTPSLPAQAGDDGANAVKACMQANLPRSFSIEEFSLISESAEGSRATVSGAIYFTRTDRKGQIGPARAMMKLEQPAALRDSAYLVIETSDYARSGMFVYLPAVARVRRVSGEMADGRLFGTDITYYDFRQFRNAMDDMAPQYLQRVESERPYHQLRFTPPQGIQAGYEYVIANIDVASCLPLRMEFMDKGRVVKTLSVPVHALRQDGARWFPGEFTLKDHIHGSRTTLVTTGFRSNPELSEQLFHPASFYRAP